MLFLSGIIHQAFQQGMMVSLLPTDYDKEVEKKLLGKKWPRVRLMA